MFTNYWFNLLTKGPTQPTLEYFQRVHKGHLYHASDGTKPIICSVTGLGTPKKINPVAGTVPKDIIRCIKFQTSLEGSLAPKYPIQGQVQVNQSPSSSDGFQQIC